MIRNRTLGVVVAMAVVLSGGYSIFAKEPLPAFAAPTPTLKRRVTLPLVDLSADTRRHRVVAAGTDSVYQGHCDTVLLPDGQTMLTAWCLGHARWIGPIARSTDAGRTWGKPLEVPQNWYETSNTPSLHRIVAADGTVRLFCFGGGLDWSRRGMPPYPMHQAYSDDGGETWTPMTPNGVQGEVPPKTILTFDRGERHIMWSDLPGYVVQSESTDGGLTWSPSRRIIRVPQRWAQPCVIRSTDGETHLMLLRENSRKYQSLFSVSHDGAKTWSAVRELPAELTGDRHVAKYAPDGRLVVAFRDVAKTSPTYGHYVAWVGRFEDIVNNRSGDYRMKLFHNSLRSDTDQPGKGNTDCGYSDLELLQDGTIVATTYLKYAPGPEQHSVMNTRFRLSETDRLAATSSTNQGWTSLFNGHDLTGWHRQRERGQHGTGGHWGATETGVLFGEQDPPGSGNGGLLLTDATYAEFELELDLRPDWGPDSGVFIRTDELGGGWQIYVDHHDHGNVGHVRLETRKYSVPFRPWGFSRIEPAKPELEMAVDERTKNWPVGVYEHSCTQQQWLQTWKPDDWNRLRIRCTGGVLPVIETWVNDLKVCHFNAAKTTHPKFDATRARQVVGHTGSIGLQVHGGKRWRAGDRVYWKNLRIRKIIR